MGQLIEQAFMVATRAFVDAHCGMIDAARAEAAEGLALAEETSEMWAEALSLQALGSLELARGNPGETHRHLGPLAERVESAGVREPGASVPASSPTRSRRSWSWGTSRKRNDCSSDSRRGDGSSTEHLRWLRRAAAADCSRVAGRPGRRARCVRQRRPRAQPGLASLRARAAAACARLIAAATRDRRGARASLEQAVVIFERLGAAIWTERTRGELGRIAGRAPSPGELTPTERRVAELVAEGRTNKEVAAELVVTVRRVESTLTKVYAKLGVRSRTSSLTACAPASPLKPRSPPATRRGFPCFGLLAHRPSLNTDGELSGRGRLPRLRAAELADATARAGVAAAQLTHEGTSIRHLRSI